MTVLRKLYWLLRGWTWKRTVIGKRPDGSPIYWDMPGPRGAA